MDRALRTSDERAALVDAITRLTQHDETNYLELKSSLDLTSTEARVKIAKAVLGFSNRPVDVAARQFEGCAYVVVGADHDGLHGIQEVDVATLEQSLAPYIGTGGDAPRWAAQFSRISGPSVLVVSVEAPTAGQRARTLRKKFANFEPGTIFVRGQAKTEVATPDEIRMLEDRYASAIRDPRMDLEVEPIFDSRGLWRPQDVRDPALIRGWLEARGKKAMHDAPARHAPRSGPLAGLAMSFPTGSMESRDAFAKRVGEYLDECEEIFPRAYARKFVLSEHNKLSVRVTNPDTRTLAVVRFELAISASEGDAMHVVPGDSKLPKVPEPNNYFLQAFDVASNFDSYALEVAHRGRPGEVSVSRLTDGVRIAWTFGDLHPGQSEVGDEVTVLPFDEGVAARWVATATNREGRKIGSFRLATCTGQRMPLP